MASVTAIAVTSSSSRGLQGQGPEPVMAWRGGKLPLKIVGVSKCEGRGPFPGREDVLGKGQVAGETVKT